MANQLILRIYASGASGYQTASIVIPADADDAEIAKKAIELLTFYRSGVHERARSSEDAPHVD